MKQVCSICFDFLCNPVTSFHLIKLHFLKILPKLSQHRKETLALNVFENSLLPSVRHYV